MGFLNHQTSKISIISIRAKISLWVFQICGFEGGVGVLKQEGPLNSTGAAFLNHQTSKISIISIWARISLWVFQICRFEGGIGVYKLRGPFNSTNPGFLNLFMMDFSFCAFADMALKVGNEWKKHGWWIQVDATQKPVLWITSYTVVEGRHWSTVGKSFGEISTISPSGSTDVLVIVFVEENSTSKIWLQRYDGVM